MCIATTNGFQARDLRHDSLAVKPLRHNVAKLIEKESSNNTREVIEKCFLAEKSIVNETTHCI